MQTIDLFASLFITGIVDIVVGSFALVQFFKYLKTEQKTFSLAKVGAILALFIGLVGAAYSASTMRPAHRVVDAGALAVHTEGAVRVSSHFSLSDIHPLVWFAVLIAPSFLVFWLACNTRKLVRVVALVIVIPIALLGIAQSIDYCLFLQNPPKLFS
ncbi:MAG: hypothetical protein H6677_07925 [Candidatus Obscuribacterales bacterium]|nr:hypothetical protein [Candidatus Obscuribacterales bacterium]